MDQDVLHSAGDVQEICLSGVYSSDLSSVSSISVVSSDHPFMDPESDGHVIDVVWFCYIHYNYKTHKKKKTLHQVSLIQFYQIHLIMNSYIVIESQGYILQQNNRIASEFLFKKDLAIPEVC